MKKLAGYLLCFLVGSIAINPLCLAETYVRSIPITCSSHANSSSAFNQRMIDFLEHWQIPGASIAVSKHDKMILSCGFGWANIEEREAVQPHSLFRLGSVSKTVTAISILQLIQENKLHFEDKVFELLADLKPLNITNTKKTHQQAVHNSDLNKITIRNLLQMSSGWYLDRPQDYDPLLGPWSSEMLAIMKNNMPPDCQTAAQYMMNIPLQFTPGTQFSYSNINYCLLGLIINKISGQPGYAGYEAYIKQQLLVPNGITEMQLGRSELKNKVPHEVTYYFTKEPNLFVDVDRVIAGLPYGDTDVLRKNYADGGWVASAPDLVKLLQAFNQYKILNAEMVKQMTEKPLFVNNNTDYPAMGWDKIKYHNGQRYLVKTGRFTGTQALILQSDNGMSYAALFNAKPSDHKQFIKELEALLLENHFNG